MVLNNVARFILILSMSCITISGVMSYPYHDKPLSNPSPSPEAVALYRFLQDMYGNKILSGQMWSPWGINEISYVYQNTGKRPAIAGFDFIHEHENSDEVWKAIQYWKAGGIPTIMWHWGAPGVGEGYENSKVGIDINKCFEEGTVEYNDMWSELEKKADHLERLRDANVPILWRPFHELNGGWFWWGMQGPELFKQLWTTMYEYFVQERGLNNLIWVLCYPGNPHEDWYPGDSLVDIAGCDTYEGGTSAQTRMYNQLEQIVDDDGMPLAYHECGVPPNPQLCVEGDAMWSWWMQWHTGHLTDTDKSYLKFIYDHPLVITRDELPDIMDIYSWDSTCLVDTVTVFTYAGEDSLVQLKEALVYIDSSLTLRAESGGEGTWQWEGCRNDTAGQEFTIPLDDNCSAIVTFTNSCGAPSTERFSVVGSCDPPTIYPYILIGYNYLRQDTITIDPGTSLTLVPKANGDTWQWTGPDIDTSANRITVAPEDSSVYTVTIINDCGASADQSFEVYIRKNIIDTTTTDTTGTGMQMQTTPDQVVIYPTFCRGQVTIECKSDFVKNNRIDILSLDGKLLEQYHLYGKRVELDISTYNPGLYLIRVTTDHFIKTAPIFIE
ncbi:MAG: hypothetical protein K9J30_06405 [Bacteroidales bacterium]|nr:hypothetical protein [Bacteroidales bacterium]